MTRRPFLWFVVLFDPSLLCSVKIGSGVELGTAGEGTRGTRCSARLNFFPHVAFC